MFFALFSLPQAKHSEFPHEAMSWV